MRRRTVVLGALAGLWGCATLPTTGPVRTQARRSQAVGSGEVAIDPNPPATGATPDLIVQGFLLAMATYQPGYQAARQYLTEAARATWQPERGMLVYADGNAPRSVGDEVTLEAPLVASLDPRGAYSPVIGAAPLRHDFKLTKDKGEWRIGNPPEGLLMSRYLFTTSHSAADVYFFDPTLTTLVPDARYFPRGNRVADAAVRALLAGPSDWLRPAVISAIPEGVTLIGDVVGQGTVTIALAGATETLSPSTRSLVAAQVAATLGLVPDIKGFRATLDGSPFVVQESSADGTVPVSVANRFDPVARLTTQLFGVASGRLVRIGDGPGAVARPVAGDFGAKPHDYTTFAITNDGVDAVMVSGDTLVRGAVEAPGTSRTVLTAKGLLRPQVSVTGATWAMTAAGAVYKIINDTPELVPAPALAGRKVIAFRLAPDGQRMALVVDENGRRGLGLVRIEKGPVARLAGWRTVPLSRDGTPVAGLLDVGWSSSSTLVVLAASGTAEQGVFELDVDAVQVRETGRFERWGATMVAASARSGPSTRPAVVSGDGVAWQYVDVFRWARLAEGVSAIAYPG